MAVDGRANTMDFSKRGRVRLSGLFGLSMYASVYLK